MFLNITAVDNSYNSLYSGESKAFPALVGRLQYLSFDGNDGKGLQSEVSKFWTNGILFCEANGSEIGNQKYKDMHSTESH